MRAPFDIYAKRIPLRGGDEYDAFTPWRKVLFWHTGERGRIERRYHKRWRRLTRIALSFLRRRKLVPKGY